MREKYESLSVTVLRDLAKSRGIKSTSAMKKADLVEAMLAKDEEEAAAVDVVPHFLPVKGPQACIAAASINSAVVPAVCPTASPSAVRLTGFGK